MNASRVYVPISSDLRHGASTPRTLNADPMQRACAREKGVTGDGVILSPPSSVTTSFYPDLSLEALRVERIRLFAILQGRGLIA